MEYIKTDSLEHHFVKVPKFIFNFALSPVAMVLYIHLYERMLISKKNGWTDKHGYVYIVYTLEEASKILRCSIRSVSRAMNQLESYDLIYRSRASTGAASHIYVKTPHIAVEPLAAPGELEWLMGMANENLPAGAEGCCIVNNKVSSGKARSRADVRSEGCT